VCKLKIAYITMQFPVRSETFATNEVRALASAGVDVSVHALRLRPKDAQQILTERELTDIQVWHNDVGTSIRGLLRGMLRPYQFLACFLWIARTLWRSPRELLKSLLLLPRAFDIFVALERNPPDVVHMFWGHYPTLVGYLIQKHLHRVRTSVSLLAYDLTRQYPCATTVVAASHVIRTHARVNVPIISRFAAVAAERVSVVHDGIDVRRVREVIKPEIRVPQRIVSVGRLIPEKGMAEVVKTFREFHKNQPDASLVLIGGGPQLEDLRELARSLNLQDSIVFTGALPHDRVLQEMARGEVFLFLSTYESERLPNVVKEAMSCGCVVVTTATPGIEDLVRHGETGYLTSAGSHAETAQLLEDILSGRARIDEVVRRAQRHVGDHFDLEQTMARYISLWSRGRSDGISCR
jgi:colanic acid/amylovoran biosynthesis glycosyltransferase